MSDGERICLQCRTTHPATAEVCTSCRASLALDSLYVPRKTTADVLVKDAFEAVDPRTRATFVMHAAGNGEAMSTRTVTALAKRFRVYRGLGAPHTIGTRALITEPRGSDAVLWLVRDRAQGTLLAARFAEDIAFSSAQLLGLVRDLLDAIAAMQARTPHFHHGAVRADNIVIRTGGEFVLGPPSFAREMAEPVADGRTDVTAVAELARSVVAKCEGDAAAAWQRWIERALGERGNAYRNAAIARGALVGVEQKLMADANRVPPKSAATLSMGDEVKSLVADVKAALGAEEAPVAKADTAASKKASKKTDDRAAVQSRAFVAGVALVLGVSCLATELFALSR